MAVLRVGMFACVCYFVCLHPSNALNQHCIQTITKSTLTKGVKPTKPPLITQPFNHPADYHHHDPSFIQNDLHILVVRVVEIAVLTTTTTNQPGEWNIQYCHTLPCCLHLSFSPKPCFTPPSPALSCHPHPITTLTSPSLTCLSLPCLALSQRSLPNNFSTVPCSYLPAIH